MSLSKSVNLAHAQTAVPCNVCEDEVPGQYYCIECKHTLCPQCEKLHRKLIKGHNVVLRTQIGDVDTTVLNCIDHGDQASFHCEKCNVSVCAKCITGKHKGHALSDLTTIFDKEKESLQNDITRMQQDILPELKKRRDEIRMQKKTYENKIQQLSKDVEDENKAFLAELGRRHNERMKSIATMKESHISAFDICTEEMKAKIELLEGRISEYQDAIGKNSLPAVINLARRKESVPEIGNRPVLPEPPTFVPRSKEKIEEIIRKLDVSYPSSVSKSLQQITPEILSKFTCPLQGWPSIYITKEGDVWLGGRESRELIMVDIKDQVLSKRTIKNRPHAMIPLDCGDVIISPHLDDSRSVSRLLNNDTENIVFDASPSCSRGVYVTADQKILVCTWDGRVVRTNSDGTYVKQIYKGSGNNSAVHAVENADGNIYISDDANSAVVILTKDEKVLSTITRTTGGQTLGSPYGLVVDKMGNTLCADVSNDCVYIIDQNQQMRELVGRSHGIQDPHWLAVDRDNNLWITQRSGTVLVVKYLA